MYTPPPIPESNVLNSVKKLLGIFPESREFDSDILMHINSAVSILEQLGVGPRGGMIITAETTYPDFLENEELIPNVTLYLYYRTKLGFDPPQSSTMVEVTKTAIQELEYRLNVRVDDQTGGVIQNE